MNNKNMSLKNILIESMLPEICSILSNHIDGNLLSPEMWQHVITMTSAITDPMGQWKHPGKCTMIPTLDGSITMHNVPFPVFGVDETGHAQYMEPGNEYSYRGRNVFEIPETAEFQTLAIQLKNKLLNGSRYEK